MKDMVSVFGDLTEAISSARSALASVYLIGSVVTALTQCFFGFRLVRFWVAFVGFIAGVVIGIRLASSGVLPEDSGTSLMILVAVGAGVLLSLLAYKLFKLGIFLFCGGVAWYAVSAFASSRLAENVQGGVLSWLILVLQGVAFVLAGWLAVRFMRTAIITITGIGGAWTAAHGLGSILPQYISDDLHVAGLFAVLAAAGILIQFLTTKEK